MITIDISKAKDIWKDKIREARTSALAKLDIDFVKAQETSSDTTSIVTDKQTLRDLPSQVDTATTTDEIKLYLEKQDQCSPMSQAKVVEAWVQSESYALSIYHTASKMLAGGSIGSESSLGKIFWSELDHMMHQTALKILGASAELSEDSQNDAAKWIKGFMFSYAGPIYAGTNEIQKNIIAERLLGLPR